MCLVFIYHILMNIYIYSQNFKAIFDTHCVFTFYFCSMKRSGSGNLDDLPGEGEFSRGGVRATAGPRLGWTNQPVIKPR
jgi:hypothetical protein